MIPQFDENYVDDDDKLIDQIKVHTNMRLQSDQESSLNDAKAS